MVRYHVNERFLLNEKNNENSEYISLPNFDGSFEVARWNEVTEEYEVIESNYACEDDSKRRAHELNTDDYEFEHKNELIVQNLGLVVSGDL